MVTNKGAFIIEVKKRGVVRIDAARYSVAATGRNSKIPMNADWMIDQTDDHADKFHELYPEFRDDDVLSVLEFVEPAELTGGFEQFRKGLFIGEGAGPRGTLVQAMEQAYRERKRTVSDNRRDQIAKELVTRFGDLCQTKSERHVEMLKKRADANEFAKLAKIA